MPFLLSQRAASQRTNTRPRAVVVLGAGQRPAALLRCLCALGLQRSAEGLFLAPGAFGVVLVPNGPPAAVTGVLAGLGPALPFAVRLTPPVPAGDWSLRAGLDAALRWAAPDGLLLTTEAEAVPEARWLAHALASPAEAMLGEVVRPGAGSDAAARHAALLAALAARIDPEPGEPAPAHGQEAAASFAIRAAVLRRLEGFPVGPEGGLAGLLAALRQRDGRVRHVPGMRVEAEAAPRPIEPALAARRRLRARRAVREFWTAGTGVFERETVAFRHWAARLGLPAGALGAALATPHFGAAWAAVEAASPALAARRLLPPAALPGQIRTLRLLLALTRQAPTCPGQEEVTVPA
ncbi:hypothetical protein [Roseicella aquatilis]|uniref:Uncharacterized protein n=1 Tax=Roseicella aquatilis TaxID=2527868 RepID=A0A4R4D4R8_9PROT|nr:hypothetical protein [Roseicella aquatilis]TCZ55274.1 hypothetical protein EXY23_22075 [Roseicella aquatilis]